MPFYYGIGPHIARATKTIKVNQSFFFSAEIIRLGKKQVVHTNTEKILIG